MFGQVKVTLRDGASNEAANGISRGRKGVTALPEQRSCGLESPRQGTWHTTSPSGIAQHHTAD